MARYFFDVRHGDMIASDCSYGYTRRCGIAIADELTAGNVFVLDHGDLARRAALDAFRQGIALAAKIVAEMAADEGSSVLLRADAQPDRTSAAFQRRGAVSGQQCKLNGCWSEDRVRESPDEVARGDEEDDGAGDRPRPGAVPRKVQGDEGEIRRDQEKGPEGL